MLWLACCSRSALEKSMSGNGRPLTASTTSVGVGASGNDTESTVEVSSSFGGAAVCAMKREGITKTAVKLIILMRAVE